jgi:hypothetical protein
MNTMPDFTFQVRYTIKDDTRRIDIARFREARKTTFPMDLTPCKGKKYTTTKALSWTKT